MKAIKVFRRKSRMYFSVLFKLILRKKGVNEDIVNDLAKQLDETAKYEFQRYHILAFDEVYVRKNLVFCKRTGKLIGYVKLTDIATELAQLERLLNDEQLASSKASEVEPTVASTLLCFMAIGIANGLKSVVACYSTANLTKEVLYEKAINEVLLALETNGIMVLGLVSDGAAVNKAFYQWLEPLAKTKYGTVFAVRNPFAPGRPLYLLADPPHLLKTQRNCLYYSGKKNKKRQAFIRAMCKNGKNIHWSTIQRLYEASKNDTIRKTFHLNQEDVYLTSSSIMRVSHAAHVLSKSTADDLRLRQWEDCEEVAKYCEVNNDIFDMMNGSDTHRAARERNPMLDVYRTEDDPRFEKLMQRWKYYEEWRTEVASSKNCTPAQKGKKIISYITLQNLERTIYAFCAAVKFVLRKAAEENCPDPFVIPSNFSQDDLEHYFSRLRSRLGSNTHPNIQEAQQAQASMHSQSALAYQSRKRGNTAGSSSRLTVEDISAPLPKRKKTPRRCLYVPSTADKQ